MELIIKINLDNAAFESKHEIARCLSEVAGEIADTQAEHPASTSSAGFIRDINGNSVGQWDIIE